MFTTMGTDRNDIRLSIVPNDILLSIVLSVIRLYSAPYSRALCLLPSPSSHSSVPSPSPSTLMLRLNLSC